MRAEFCPLAHPLRRAARSSFSPAMSHIYARFAPYNRDANGSDVGRHSPDHRRHGRQGAYGRHPYGVHTRAPGLAGATTANAWGVLKLTLYPGGYGWEFLPVAGKTFTDSGSDSCHAAPSTSTPSPSPNAHVADAYTVADATPDTFDLLLTPSPSPTPTATPHHTLAFADPDSYTQRQHLLPLPHPLPRRRLHQHPRRPPASRFKRRRRLSTPLPLRRL